MRERGGTGSSYIIFLCFLSIGVVSLFWRFTNLVSAYRSWVLVGYFSAGVLLLIEAAILRGRSRQLRREQARLRKKEVKSPEELAEEEETACGLKATRQTEEWYWRLGASLLLASSFGFVFSGHLSWRPNEPGEIRVRFSDQIENSLTKLSATSPPSPNTGPAAIDSTLKLDPKLAAALEGYFRKPAGQNGSMPWGVLVVIALAVTAAVAVLVWLAIKHEPEATPLTAAIATLTATAAVIEKLVKEGRILPSSHCPWPAVLVSLLLVTAGICLIWIGSRYLLRLDINTHGTSIKNGALLGAAVLVFGFSAALLAIVPPILFHSDPVPPPPPVACAPCQTTPPVLQEGKIVALPLRSVNGLGDGRRKEEETVDPIKIQPLTDDLVKSGARDGDILLLLGSADCISTKRKMNGGRWDSNEELATARAEWVRNGLKDQPAAHGITIMPLPLAQHERCGATPNVRAVYPFLFHADNNRSADSRP
jgi:hypothetical protein